MLTVGDEEVVKTQLALLRVRVRRAEQVQVLSWWRHQSPSRRVRKHNNAFHAHPNIVPAARVVLERQIFLIMLRVVRRDRRFILHISGDVLPINNLVLDRFAITN